MSEQIFYKATVPCRIGGAYRRAGEVFPLPEFRETPPFLVKMGPEAEASDEPAEKTVSKKKARSEAPGPLPADLPGVARD